MVTFLTFFLGLWVGPHTVELAVDQKVASIELRLDGETLGVVEGEPWRMVCDFGLALKPHVLEAIAFDDEGRELGRAEQHVNLPTPEATAAIALRDYRDGRYESADLAWRTVYEESPDQIHVMFDGEPIELEGERSVRLPPYDPRRIHILSAELVFREERRARVEMAFGGQYGEEVSTELTAVAIELVGARKTPTVAELRGHVLVRGSPARVVAVEDERAEVLVVRERSAIPKLKDVAIEAWEQARSGSRRGSSSLTAAQFLSSAVRRNDSLRYVLTTPRTIAAGDGLVTKMFTVTPNYNIPKNRGMGFILTHAYPEESILMSGEWLGSAVAQAGVLAAGSNRSRAVVLILGDGVDDLSGYEPDNVAEFLDILNVPLLVWRASDLEGSESEWGTVSSIAKLKDLNRAMKELKRRLERQFVAWLDGTYLPEEISLSAQIQDRIRLAGSEPLPQ